MAMASKGRIEHGLTADVCREFGRPLGKMAAARWEAEGRPADDAMDCAWAEEHPVYGALCRLIIEQEGSLEADPAVTRQAGGLVARGNETPLYAALREGMYEGVRQYNLLERTPPEESELEEEARLERERAEEEAEEPTDPE